MNPLLQIATECHAAIFPALLTVSASQRASNLVPRRYRTIQTGTILIKTLLSVVYCPRFLLSIASMIMSIKPSKSPRRLLLPHVALIQYVFIMHADTELTGLETRPAIPTTVEHWPRVRHWFHAFTHFTNRHGLRVIQFLYIVPDGCKLAASRTG